MLREISSVVHRLLLLSGVSSSKPGAEDLAGLEARLRASRCTRPGQRLALAQADLSFCSHKRRNHVAKEHIVELPNISLASEFSFAPCGIDRPSLLLLINRPSAAVLGVGHRGFLFDFDPDAFAVRIDLNRGDAPIILIASI